MMPRNSIPKPITQLSSRGLRNAPVKKMHHHRGDEQDRRPVVDLPHQQTAADVERDVQRRGVGLGHVQALEQAVRALVLDLAHRRLEPERQEDAGQDQDDEAVERDLAEHERPVVGEDLAQVLLPDLADAQSVVDPLDRWREFLRGHCCHPRSQKLGPTGSVKPLCATR
jgi:hypothetical protein